MHRRKCLDRTAAQTIKLLKLAYLELEALQLLKEHLKVTEVQPEDQTVVKNVPGFVLFFLP